MIKKILSNNKGSALPMVIIIITVISTLGVAIMSLGLAHYKVGMADKKVKTSFYMAESGLEQAYKIMLEEVGEAIQAGNNEVNSVIEAELLAEIERIENGEQEGFNYVRSYFFDLTAGEYVIDADWGKIKSDLDNGMWDTDFQNGYKEHFNTTSNGQYQLVNRLKDVGQYEDLLGGGTVNPFEIGVLSCPTPPTKFFAASDMSKEVTLYSKYIKEEMAQKVQMTFTVQVPSEIPKTYYVYEDVAETYKVSPIWDNVLTASGDIKVINATNSNINIIGNVYAYGTIPQVVSETKELSNYGGFVLTGNTNNVTITGDLVTHANLQINDANTSAITVSGEVLANNLAINGSDEYADNQIVVLGDVYTLDDLEINGRKSLINIEGNYFGFSDGAASVRHNQSSCIVINSEDIAEDNGSSLTIAGGVFLLGSSYIDVTGGPVETGGLYQTGESLSLKGNYRVYSYFLPDEYIYKYYDPIYLVEKEIGKTTNMSVMDKAEFFYRIVSEEGPVWARKDNGNVQLATGSESYIYTLGAYFNNNTVYEKGIAGLDFVERTKNDCQKLYNDKIAEFDLISDYVSITNRRLVDTASEYVFCSQTQDVYLIGPGGNTNVPAGSEAKILTSSNIYGIIITGKDVYLRGNLNYRGLIVAGGNVYFQDNYPKTFSSDYHYVKGRAEGWDDLIDPFVPGYPDEPVIERRESSIGVTEATSVLPYKKYINIDQWAKV